MAINNATIKRYRVRPELRSLFKKLVKTKYEPAGVLVNTGLGKSIDPERHGPALKALDQLEKIGLLEVVEEPMPYFEKP